MTKKIIIDTDPGIDDSMAILSAFRSLDLEILGLTTTFGNSNISNCTINALRLVELDNKINIPVTKGSSSPLFIKSDIPPFLVHGHDGMGDSGLFTPVVKIDDRIAANFIVEMVKKYPHEVTLVSLGPLTNIALALHQAPEIAFLVKEIVLMGGSVYSLGNVSPVAEANIFRDPHAAEIVLRAAWDVTMIGLDVTTKIIFESEDLKLLYRADNSAVNLLQKIQTCYRKFHKSQNLPGEFFLHDPSVISYLIDPLLFSFLNAPVHVETTGKCIGKTVADVHLLWGERKQINIAIGVNDESVKYLLIDLLSK